jgi:2-phospho-L-lactate guanylyltransferase
VTVAILPVKPFAVAKTRLAPMLTPTEREQLARGLFRQTLAALGGCPLVQHIVVVGPAEAQGAGVGWQPDPGGGLNAALAAALTAVAAEEAALVVPTDLPLLTPEALAALLSRRLPGTRQVVVVPDRRGEGTNTLLLQPPDVIAPAFGPASLAAHLQAAQAAGARATVVTLPALAFDLDYPADLHVLPAGVLAALLARGAAGEAPIPTPWR